MRTWLSFKGYAEAKLFLIYHRVVHSEGVAQKYVQAFGRWRNGVFQVSVPARFL